MDQLIKADDGEKVMPALLSVKPRCDATGYEINTKMQRTIDEGLLCEAFHTHSFLTTDEVEESDAPVRTSSEAGRQPHRHATQSVTRGRA